MNYFTQTAYLEAAAHSIMLEIIYYYSCAYFMSLALDLYGLS